MEEDSSNCETDVQKLFSKYYTDWSGKHGEKLTDTKHSTIPIFYKKLPSEDDQIQMKLREEARTKFLQKKSKELMSNSELEELWECLQKYRTHPDTGNEQYISYLDFMKVKDCAPSNCRQFFTATNFAKLQNKDPYGRIPIHDFFNYVMRKMWLQQTRIGLSLYDCFGMGYLRETDLDNYIHELIPTLPQLECLESSFHSFYVCTATRKFFFFLDPLRSGKVRIMDILASGFLEDLLQLREEDTGGSGGTGQQQQQVQGTTAAAAATGQPSLSSTGNTSTTDDNWFSAPSTLRVYGTYLSLDRDHNGMLSKAELEMYNGGTLTSAFIDRVFDECMTYEGEMDYKSYLDFVLALENRKETQSLHYLFRLLDIEHKGYLNLFNVYYFYKSLKDKIQVQGGEAVSFEDIQDEIFDMVKPKNPEHITLQDLINCGQGETVLSIMIDVNSFWTYENREVVLSEASQQAVVASPLPAPISTPAAAEPAAPAPRSLSP